MEKIQVLCHRCQLTFLRDAAEDRKKFKRFGNNPNFCSRKCFVEYQHKDKNAFLVECSECKTETKKTPCLLKKLKNGRSFCSSSCAARYNNRLKRKSRRSKCEQMLLELIQENFPLLRVIPNDKTMLDGYEADIAIPNLNIAIEWNGIVHFKPIYGAVTFDKVLKNDLIKQSIAERKGIELIIVADLSSTPKRVKEAFEEIKIRLDFLLSNKGV